MSPLPPALPPASWPPGSTPAQPSQVLALELPSNAPASYSIHSLAGSLLSSGSIGKEAVIAPSLSGLYPPTLRQGAEQAVFRLMVE